MKKLASMCLLMIAVGCGKPPLPPVTNGTPVSTQGLQACDGRSFPIGKGGSSHCCMDSQTAKGKEVYFVIGMTGDRGFGHRYLGQACTTENRINEHGMSEAVKFGPCGAAKRPDAVENARDVHIFKPVLPSSGDVCGYKYVIPPPTAVEQPIRVSIPEEFISTKQAEYPKVDPTCPYTVCKGTTPATAVTVVLTTSAGVRMGRVVSNPPGITVSAAGKTSAMFSGDVTLTAEPTNKHARAVFSGDCSKTGGYGERAECIVKLAPDPNITVDFECEQGFTCGAGGKR